MTEELLRGCFMRLKDKAAAGIDQVTKQEYALNLDENLIELVSKLHRMAFIPQPVKRVYIPKAGSKKQRPIGIPTLEDKLVQSALARIVQTIYERGLNGDSAGVVLVVRGLFDMRMTLWCVFNKRAMPSDSARRWSSD